MSPEMEGSFITVESETLRDRIVGDIAASAIVGTLASDEEVAASSPLDEIHKQHPEIEVRQYQLDCLEALEDTRSQGKNRALVHMATGLGKTTIAATDVKGFLDENPESRVLFLCHQNEILRQARKRFRHIIGTKGVTYGNFTGISRTNQDVTCLFSSFQTMKNHRERFASDEFDYVVVDESHHGKAETYEPTINYFKPKFLLGLTGTPDRGDLQDIREIFGQEVYSKNLAQALAEGLLARPDYRVILDDINERVLEQEDVTLAELNRTVFIPKRDEEIARIIRERLAEIDNPRVIGFCTSILHSERIAELLPGIKVLHSKMKGKRAKDEALTDFREGRTSGLFTVDMFNEGIDIADANVIVFLRSTESETIFLQQLGRGLRKLPDKDSVLVLDFVANCDRLLMIERLLHDSAVAIGRTRPVKMEPGEDYELHEDEEIDLYGMDFNVFEDDLDTIRELDLGSFEFSETTRKIMEVIRRIQAERVAPAPEGSVSIRKFAEDTGVSRPVIYKIIQEKDWKPARYSFSGRPGDSLSQEQAVEVMNHPSFKPSQLPEGHIGLREFVESNDITYHLVKRILGDRYDSLPIFTIGSSRAAGLSSEIQQELLALPEIKTKNAPEGSVSINGFAQKHGISPTTVGKAVNELGLELPVYKFGPQLARSLDESAQSTLVAAIPGLQRERAPADHVSVTAFSNEKGIAEATLLKMMGELDIQPGKHTIKGHDADTLSPEQAEQLSQSPYLSIGKAPVGWKSLYSFAQENGTSRKTVIDIAETSGARLTKFKVVAKRGGRITDGLLPEDQAKVLAVLEQKRNKQ